MRCFGCEASERLQKHQLMAHYESYTVLSEEFCKPEATTVKK